MTVQLTCRLLESKLLLRSEVAVCLRESVSRGIAFVQTLMERVPSAGSILESEFARWHGPTIATLPLPVDVELTLQLPLGMCERFLALPLRRQNIDDPVPLAIVDPFDTHVLSEFRFCLGRAVTPLRTPFSHLVYALATVHGNVSTSTERATEGPRTLAQPSTETPAFGTKVMSVGRSNRRTRDFGENMGSVGRRGYTLPPVDTASEPSEPPLPLVRTTMAPGPLALGPLPPNPLPTIAPSVQTAPQVTGQAVPGPNPTAKGRASRDSEPVLKLVKQKPATLRASIPPPPRSPDENQLSPEATLAGLADAQNPRQLIERMHQALEGASSCQAYFSVRAESFVLEHSNHATANMPFALTQEQQNVLRTACRSGYFLGPLPADSGQAALGTVLNLRDGEEIYVAPVNVKNRAALVVVVGHFDESFAVTRWVDAVVARAGQVLEQLARAKKHR